MGDKELRKLHAGPRRAAVRGRGRANGLGSAADTLPDGTLGPRLPGAGLDGRHRGIFAHAYDRDRAGRSPEHGVDDVAARCRLANAGFGGPVAWLMTAPGDAVRSVIVRRPSRPFATRAQRG